jgi:hypothetical protein
MTDADAADAYATDHAASALLCVPPLVWCKGGCQHQADADLHRLVDSGRGDVPLTRLKFRCSNCGSDRTDFVVTSRDNPQPW